MKHSRNTSQKGRVFVRNLGFALVALAALLSISNGLHAQIQKEKLKTKDVRGIKPKVAVISFRGVVDTNMYNYVQRKLADAEKREFHIAVLDMETYGGEVEAAAKIRDALLATNLVTMTYVHNRAISAGALVAISTQHIYMSPSGTIGDAAPVTFGMEGVTELGEKFVSGLRAEFRATAEATARNPQIAEAMVDKDIAIPDVIEQGKLLTFTANQALKHGYSDGSVIGLDEAIKSLGKKLGFTSYTVKFYTELPAESFARFLSNPIVSSILTIIGLVLMFVEIKTPGFGVAGSMSLVCFALLFWGQSIADLAGWEEIVLFIAGVVLLLLEIFVTPGFGLLGILGIFSIASSLIFAFSAFQPSDPFFYPQDFSLPSMFQPLLMFAIVILVSIGLIILLGSVLPSTPLFNAITLKTSETREEGFHSTEDKTLDIVGRIGYTSTPLRPSGVMILGDERIDVVSEGGLIDYNREVEVIAVEGRRVIVRETGR